MREGVRAHSGEAFESRLAFQVMSPHEQGCVIEFLKSLQILPPSAKDTIVNEEGARRGEGYSGRSLSGSSPRLYMLAEVLIEDDFV